jgi:hypothetical protein
MKIECTSLDSNVYITIGKVYEVIKDEVLYYKILNDGGMSSLYFKCLFKIVDTPAAVKTVEPSEGVTNTLAVESFLQQMPMDSYTIVSTSFDKRKLTYTVFIYGDEFVADTKGHLQEIMKALLVLYKET